MSPIGSPNGASKRQRSSSWSEQSWIRLSWRQRGTSSFGKSSPTGWRKRVTIEALSSASASGKTSLPATRYLFSNLLIYKHIYQPQKKKLYKRKPCLAINHIYISSSFYFILFIYLFLAFSTAYAFLYHDNKGVIFFF